MKKRSRKVKILLLLILMVAYIVIGTIIGTSFHEFGHALMGICFRAPIVELHIGILSYIKVDVINTTNFQLAMISIGSFIFPEMLYLILFIFKKYYATVFRIAIGSSLYANAIMSIGVLLFGTKEPEMRDIMMFQQYSNVKSEVIIVGLAVLVITNIILESKQRGFKNLILYIDEKLNS